MNIVAIIPAKADSKRVPKKNLIPFMGKPLPVWAIEAAKGSRLITRTIVSTGDEEIAQMAREHGADVPYMEPASFAAMGGDIEGLVRYAAQWLQDNEGAMPDAFVLLQTTNPLRRPEDLDHIIEQFIANGADSTLAVCRALGNHNPHWMLVNDEQEGAKLFTGGALRDIPRRSDHLPPCYFRNDIAYILKPQNLFETPSNLYGKKVDLYLMDEIYDADINTPEDWHVAESKMRRLFSLES